MITLFAGLQDVPPELLEATQVDGARLETFRMVIFPTILPSISTAVLLSTIWAYNSFTLPIIMTGGGPLRATEIFGLYIFKLAFDAFDFGAAAACSLSCSCRSFWSSSCTFASSSEGELICLLTSQRRAERKVRNLLCFLWWPRPWLSFLISGWP